MTLLALPMLGFIWLSVSTLLQSANIKSEMSAIASLTQLSVIYSELVHEVQKERGMTAGYIGSKGAKFVDKLKGQRKNTDAKRQKQMKFWQEHDFQLDEIVRLNTSINQAFNELSSIRQRVNSQAIPLGEALKYYTALNTKLLSVAVINARISTDALVTKEILAYYNFLQGKERAGIERAVLSNTFAKDEFGQGMLTKFITLMSEQNTYFDNFNQFTNKDNQAYFTQQLKSNSVKEVVKLRAIATSKLSGFNVKAEYWFAQSTGRIIQLKKTEDYLSNAILTLVEEKEMSASRSLMINLLSSIVLILLATSVGLYTIRELIQRVNNLTSVMAKVRHDNDLTVHSTLEDNSELGQISTALNKTLTQFSNVIKDISSSSISLASGAEETSKTCEYNSQSLLGQQDGIALIATAIEQLSATVREVASNTQSAASSAKEADDKTKEGFKTVQDSYHAIEVLATEIDSLAIKITRLHESSTKITSVIDVIKSVADQTNLLALNAAIEAARAGEHGRGFAVVADEVKTLAQRTQDSTTEIESLILSLQTDANAAFNVIETSQDKTEQAVNTSKNVEFVLEDIAASVNTIFAMTDQIATAIEEQAVVTQDIAQNVVLIEDKSVETTAGANQIAVTARDQAKLATSLQDIANIFKV